MMKTHAFLLAIGLLIFEFHLTDAQKSFTDTLHKGNDTLIVHMIGHGSVYFEYKNLVIQIDPYSSVGDYSKMPKADLIFITHGHSDHFDINAIGKVKKTGTLVVFTQECKNSNKYTETSVVMKNGDSSSFSGIPVKAVPAYNLTASYHPKGTGNGYIFTFGMIRVYVAGDTEKISEMSTFGTLDVAFIPVKLPYTMTAQVAAEVALILKPTILYPYHYDDTDLTSLVNTLKDEKSIDVRLSAKPQKVDTPLAVLTSDVSHNSFTANWAAIPAATGYKIDVATDSLFKNMLSGYSSYDVGNTTTITISGLLPETNYFFRVRAYNANSESNNSNVIFVKTLFNTSVKNKMIKSVISFDPESSTLVLTGIMGYSSVSVFNISGQMLSKMQITGNETCLNLQNLSDGLFVVLLDGRYGGKFLKR